jgi:hypothetical protein
MRVLASLLLCSALAMGGLASCGRGGPPAPRPGRPRGVWPRHGPGRVVGGAAGHPSAPPFPAADGAWAVPWRRAVAPARPPGSPPPASSSTT